MVGELAPLEEENVNFPGYKMNIVGLKKGSI
jgi:hypothetical protein